MDGCKCTSKVFLGFLSLIFWGIAAGLVFIGAWVYKEYQHYDKIAESLYTLIPATVLMAVGVFLFLLGIVGCIGAFKEQKCLLGLFFTLVLIIFVGLATAAVLAYVYHGDVDEGVHKGITDGLNHYGNNSVWTSEVDFMQKELKCCGVANYSDWMNTDWYRKQNATKRPYPESCCMNQTCMYAKVNDTQLYTQGCYSELKDQFLNHLGVIAGVAASFAVIEILGMIAACVLICKRQTEVPYIGLSEPQGMRV